MIQVYLNLNVQRWVVGIPSLCFLLCVTALQGMKITTNIFQAENHITMTDSELHTRPLGTTPEGVKDQYADGKAARVWEAFIGDKNSRTQHYRQFLVGLLRSKGCRTVLDVACGTGWDGGSSFVHLHVWIVMVFWNGTALQTPLFKFKCIISCIKLLTSSHNFCMCCPHLV